MTFQTRALDLARAFQLKTRDNGSSFQYIPDNQPAWMLEAVRSAHHDEFPNDWRFAVCCELAYKLSNYETADNAREEALDMASDAADIYHSKLLKWYADDPSRLAYVDEWIADTGADSADDVAGHLFAGQTYCIEQMLHGLIDACEAQAAKLSEVVA